VAERKRRLTRTTTEHDHHTRRSASLERQHGDIGTSFAQRVNTVMRHTVLDDNSHDGSADLHSRTTLYRKDSATGREMLIRSEAPRVNLYRISEKQSPPAKSRLGCGDDVLEPRSVELIPEPGSGSGGGCVIS